VNGIELAVKLTWNGQIIQCHPMKTRVNEPLLVPPSKSISNVLWVSAEIAIEFITKVGFGRGGKCWQIVEDVVGRQGRALMDG